MDATAPGRHAVGDADAAGLESLDGPACLAAATSCTTSLPAAADMNLASLLSASYYYAAPEPLRRKEQRSSNPQAPLPLYGGLEFTYGSRLDEDRRAGPGDGTAAADQPGATGPLSAQKTRKRRRESGDVTAAKPSARKPGRPPKTAESLNGEDPEEVSSSAWRNRPASSRAWRLTRASSHSDVADSSAWHNAPTARARSPMFHP